MGGWVGMWDGKIGRVMVGGAAKRGATSPGRMVMLLLRFRRAVGVATSAGDAPLLLDGDGPLKKKCRSGGMGGREERRRNSTLDVGRGGGGESGGFASAREFHLDHALERVAGEDEGGEARVPSSATTGAATAAAANSNQVAGRRGRSRRPSRVESRGIG